MTKVEIKLDVDGVMDILKSPEIQEVLQEYGEVLEAKCGSGYEAKTSIGSKRASVKVKAVSKKAKRDNLKNNTLVKALNSMRGSND